MVKGGQDLFALADGGRSGQPPQKIELFMIRIMIIID